MNLISNMMNIYTVSSQRKNKPFLPLFMIERFIRTALQYLYVGTVGSSSNARLLLEKDPWNIDFSLVRGNDLVRRCFISACTWLTDIHDFTLSDKIYREQILEPSRSAAHFVLFARKLSEPTIKLDGMVFCKSSQYYNKTFGNDRVSLSIILPEIEGIMSLRCEADMCSNVELGMYSIDGIQPIPYVNRIRQGDFLIQRKQNDMLSLSKLDFMKVSFLDTSAMSHSFAFENFCEIETDQISKTRRRLGSACVLGGVLESLNIPVVTLRGILRKDLTINLYLHRKLYSGIDTSMIRSLYGKPVRILAVFWNTLGFREIEYPEAFDIEEAKDAQELLLDDILGFVRMRKNVPLETILSYYPSIDHSLLPSRLRVMDECITWRGPYQNDSSISDYFLKQKEKLSDIRCLVSQGQGVPALADVSSVFSTGKLTTDGLCRIISHNDDLKKCLLDIIRKNDTDGISMSSWGELANAISNEDHDRYVARIGWLKKVRLLRKSRDGTIITPSGLNMGYCVAAQEIKDLLEKEISESRNSLISIIELEQKCCIAPSLLIRGLNELEENGDIVCSALTGRRFQVFWFAVQSSEPVPDNTLGAFNRELETLVSIVLSILGSVSYPLSTAKIVDMVKESRGIVISGLSAKLFLSELVARGILAIDGDSWLYRWEDRIDHIFSSKPDIFFTLDNIIDQASIPPIANEKVLGILLNLENRKKIIHVLSFWIGAIDKEAKIKKLLKSETRKFILQQLSSNRGSLSQNRISGMALHFVYNMPYAITGIRPQQIYSETIEEMRQKGEIFLDDGMLCLKENTADSPSSRDLI